MGNYMLQICWIYYGSHLLESWKSFSDKTHFEYNISFYADADHFEEDPVRQVFTHITRSFGLNILCNFHLLS